jgi:hypothetical protein
MISDDMSTVNTRVPAAGVQDSDLALLRAYEPVVRFTEGELFRPTAVGPYVDQCSLWAGVRGGDLTLIVPAGELTLDRLCEASVVHQGRRLFLRFVEQPLGRAEYLRWLRIPRERLRATGRFTTTGVFGRLVDAGMRASLLLRGKVPAGLAAAAETIYRERLEADRFTYYGRVVRDGGYVCLQYWFFYAMNDWRSTFGGVNDHEADWEMITIYLAEQSDGVLRPAWAAFSSHDYHGDDLRRRWDDPELHREGDRPVVFAGAGSHSGAFIPGDYVVSVDPPQLRPVINFLHRLQRLSAPWRHYTGSPAGVGIPFVDYARGDGVTIGPGHDKCWSAVLIDDETPWVRDYRGLWGLDTRDRFGGERAPSGPRYERDGSVRASWANPLGWSGARGRAQPNDRRAHQPGRGTPGTRRHAQPADPARATTSAHQKASRAISRTAGAAHAFPQAVGGDQHPTAAGLHHRRSCRLLRRVDCRHRNPRQRVHRGGGHRSPKLPLVPGQHSSARRHARARRRVSRAVPQLLADRDLGGRRGGRACAHFRQPQRRAPPLRTMIRISSTM